MPHRASGQSLVILQFLTLAAQLLLAASALREQAPQVGAVLLALCALGLGVWALLTNRPGNFNIHPAPREGGQLIDSGPYRWIRHPMYTALMMLGGACAWVTDSFPGWMLGLTLICVLAIKALLEEWMLARAHPAYVAYRSRTKAFIPLVF